MSCNCVIQNGTTSTVNLTYMDTYEFDRHIRDLAMFKKIDKDRYFQLIKLYNSKEEENRIMASNIVLELHDKLVEE